jgi:cytidylate kinase
MQFITVSRKLGSGGAEVARAVAKKLSYPLYDTEAIEQAAREMGFLESVREIDERAPSFFRRILSNRPTVDLDRLNSVVYELAKRGDAVFLGRGSHLLLRSFNCGLHVRITASREKRIQSLMAKGFQKEAATKAVDQSDQERSAFTKFAFGVDWDNPDVYDLVLNTDKLSLDLAVETIIQVAHSKDIQACSVDALRTIEIMALATRVDAAILEAGLTYAQNLSVSAKVLEPGAVELTGIVENEGSKAKAEEVVKTVPGVRLVENHIRVAPATRYA